MTFKTYDEMNPDQQAAYRMGRRVGFDDGRAAAWRDFPTDEMVEAANAVHYDHETVAKVLEAVRRVMYGEET